MAVSTRKSNKQKNTKGKRKAVYVPFLSRAELAGRVVFESLLHPFSTSLIIVDDDGVYRIVRDGEDEEEEDD